MFTRPGRLGVYCPAMTLRRFNNISPNIAASAWVDETALLIGDVSLDEDASVWPMSVIRADVNSITIGKRSNIQDGCILHVNHESPYNTGSKLIIGDEVTIGHRVTLHGCRIEDTCLIGMAAVIMDDVVVGTGCVIGAGALIPPGKRLEPGCLYVGSPARRVRKLEADILQQIRYAAQHYVHNKNSHSGTA